METSFLITRRVYANSTSPHSLGKSVEWKPDAERLISEYSEKSPLAGEIS
jgi:hypothetical protein